MRLHNHIHSLALLLMSSIVTAQNTTTYPTRFSGVTWDNDAWAITTTNLDQGHYQSRLTLSNGYFGINLASVGPFMDFDIPVEGDNINGWPLFDSRQAFSTIAGFWNSQERTNGTNYAWLLQYGQESVISGIPHWAGLVVQANGQDLTATVNASQISDFSSTLNMKQGLMSWTYGWTPTGGSKLNIKYEMFVHKLYINRAAVRLTLTPSSDTNVSVIDVFDGDCAKRSDFVNKSFNASTASIWTAVSPNGLPNVKAYLYSTLTSNSSAGLGSVSLLTSGPFGANESSIAQEAQAQLFAGNSISFTKFVGVASSDAFSDPASVARSAALAGSQAGWDNLLRSHVQEWATIFPADSVDSYVSPDTQRLPDDENVLELHINAVSNPFHLIQNTIGENSVLATQNNSKLDTNSLSVCGLGSDCYGGLVFWDADVWMAPGLVISHPRAAKQIANYRAKLFGQAKENIKTAYQSSKNATGLFSEGGAAYPWTSGRFGNCTGTGPCFDYQYHLNGDIGLQLFNYYATTGNQQFLKEELLPIHSSVAWFFSELLTRNATTGQYGLFNASDPDEYANNVDNVGYTLALIKTHLNTANILRERNGLEANTTWTERAANITVPVDENAGIVLEYAGMNGSITIKQADTVLIDDFLDFDNPYALASLDYYAGKQSPDGPAMTYGVYSIVANEISPSGCSSYTYELYGSQPYSRAPWFQYSEQLIDSHRDNGGTHPAFPFLTGMGGSNRVSVFGYLGYRVLLDSLNISPSLPPTIRYLRYRTIYWQGHPISAWSNNTHTSISRLSGTLAGANSTFVNASIPVTFGYDISRSVPLAPNGTIVVPNRLIGFNATQDGNIAQCKPANSTQEWVPGQFPLAAVDGAISTKWQPVASNVTSSIIVDLGEVAIGINVTGFHMDWAQHPPSSWQVDFSATSSFSNTNTAYNTTTVQISNPYDAARALEITPYIGNTTDVALPSAIQATRFVRLSIAGNQGGQSERGATVAEFTVLRQGGGRLVPNDVVQSL